MRYLLSAILVSVVGLCLSAQTKDGSKISGKGDLRVRYQYEKREGKPERERGRIRLRGGVEAKVNDKVRVHFGLASGENDPRSTNLTFENTFELKDIRLDYAYAEYNPSKWATLLGGRMSNPLWAPGDMLWDTDIRPEGVGGKFKWELNPKLEPYMNSGFFLIDEEKEEPDPLMYVFQPGLKSEITENIDLKFATAYYKFENISGKELEHSKGKNTVKGEGGNFTSVVASFELGLPRLSVFGEYINNLDAKESKNGYMVGAKIGYEKVKDFGQWRVKYINTSLETFAWPDVFPDSDRYGGRTGIKGHEVVLTFGLGKNWNLDLDYYVTDKIDNPDETENLFQVDLNFKF